MSTAAAAPAATEIGRTRWFRLIPIGMVVYIISFMDRTNISYAFSGIGHDFHVGRAAQGAAGGIFFIGYVLLQIPGGHLAEHWSAKKFITVMILFWGTMAILCGLAQTYTQLLVARFFLGVAEGGIWPAMLVLISHWFPVRERARAYSFWMANLAISSIITQPLSGWIMATTDWRTLFFIEGALPFIIALPLWVMFVKDWPHEAPWCSPAERDYIESSLARDRANDPPHVPFRAIFTHGTVWQLVLVYFLVQIGFYGLNMWLPTLLKHMTEAGFGAVGLIAALPYLAAIIAMWVNGSFADHNGNYPLHVLIPMAVAAVSLVLSVTIGAASIPLAVLFICLAMAGALSYDGPFWAAASRALPAAVVGGAMGLINALGNLGGYFGPFLGGYLQDATGGSFVATAILLAASLLAAGIVMMTVRVRRGAMTVAK
ncbi:MAG TPA: MFS transporter [Acetobacteraceae bacterium]|nr:MFS transporter [Acetobacteraceae bacterium]